RRRPSTMCETKGVRNKPLKPGHFNLAGKRTFKSGLDTAVCSSFIEMSGSGSSDLSKNAVHIGTRNPNA
ncbi:hypothetical protein, partial [Paraburkholderia domus]|uniref:hypothetical protein n=1 Tax=Paraburkholderia domus TaxID=2793075 RepID=UPI001B8D4183